MPRFIYIGGTESDGTAMPAAVVSFGLRFIEGVPKEVLPEDFTHLHEYEHAVRKLTGNQFFRLVNDEPGTVEILDSPKRKRTRKPVEVAEYVNPIVEDVVE